MNDAASMPTDMITGESIQAYCERTALAAVPASINSLVEICGGGAPRHTSAADKLQLQRELALTVIDIARVAGRLGLDLGAAVAEQLKTK